MTPEERLDRHRAIAAALEAIGDEDLAEWLGASEPLRRDGFARLTLPGGGSPAFVKLLPVTDLELEPHNWLSTANCFGLTHCYGYVSGRRASAYGASWGPMRSPTGGSWRASASSSR